MLKANVIKVDGADDQSKTYINMIIYYLHPFLLSHCHPRESGDPGIIRDIV